MSTFFNSNMFSIGRVAAPSRANLLQFRGWAVAKEMKDLDGFGLFDLHFELHNLAPSEAVTITHAEWYHASHGGWLTFGPNAMLPPLLSGTSVADTDISYNGIGWGLSRLSHLIFLFRVERPGYYQHLIGQLPITSTPATQQSIFPAGLAPSVPWAAPDPLPLSAPVFLTLMEDLFQFPILNGEEVWIPVIGQVVNGTGDAIEITELRWRLESADHQDITGDFPLKFFTGESYYDMNDGPSDKKVFQFNWVIRPPLNQVWTRLKIRCTYSWQGDPSRFVFSRNYSFDRTATVSPFSPSVRFVAPVGPVQSKLRWGCTNGPQDDGQFNSHNLHPAHRYAYDLILNDGRSTSEPGFDQNNNDSFFTFRKPVLAMADGTVVKIEEAQADNQGRTPADPVERNNGIVVQHANNFYAAYIHTRQHSIAELGIRPGQHVKQGQQIAEVGNAGTSSEPHLHIMCWRFDERTGVVQSVPMQWDNIEDENGRRLSGIPTSGTQFRVI